MRSFAIALASWILLTTSSVAQPISPAVRSQLAPTGELRVGIHFVNIFLVGKDPETGELSGVAIDLARELGRRVGVPVVFVGYANASRLTRAANSGEWDVSFQAAEASRAADITFTAGFAEMEVTYLVPAESPIRVIADVDREGARIAVAGNGASDRILTRTLKNAQLVRAQGFAGSLDAFVSAKLDAVAGLRPQLVMAAENLPGSRVLEEHFAVLPQAIGTPRDRDVAARYLREFVEEAKASGLVARAIAKAGVRGMPVAPMSPPR